MKINPIGDRLLVERVEIEKESNLMIAIPDTAKKKSLIGKVIAVGTGEDAEDFKEGDLVTFGEYAGESIGIEGEDCLIVSVENILAKVES